MTSSVTDGAGLLRPLKLRDATQPDAAAARAFYDAFQRGAAPTVRLQSAHQARVIGETPTGPLLRFILFSEGVKRDGSEVKVDGLDLANLRANPRVMWVHRYDSLPVGNWVNFDKATHPILGRVLYADAAPLRTTDGTEHLEFARMLFEMYRNNDLSAVSGGWHPLEVETMTDDNGFFTGFRFVRSDVLEGSMVPIPADPQALQVAIQRGVIPTRYVDRFIRAAGDEPGIYVVREARAVRLDEVAEPATPVTEPDAEPVAEAPVEPVADAPTPEPVEPRGEPMPELTFEIQQRIGAVLSKKNKTAIKDAIVVLQAVLEAAGDGAEEPAPEERHIAPVESVGDPTTEALVAEATSSLTSRLAALAIAHERAVASEFYASILGRVERLRAQSSRDCL